MYHAPPMQPVAPLSAVDSPQGSGIAGVLVFAAMAAGMFWLYGKGGKMDWADMNRVLYMETRRRMPRLDVDRLDLETLKPVYSWLWRWADDVERGAPPMLTQAQKDGLWVVVAVIRVYQDGMEDRVFGPKGRMLRTYSDSINNVGRLSMEILMKKWPRYSEGEDFPDVPTLKSNRKKRRR
jgi:hypothetical protein